MKPKTPGISTPLKVAVGTHIWVTWLENYAGVFNEASWSLPPGLVSSLSGGLVSPENTCIFYPLCDRPALRKSNKDSHKH